MGKSRQVPWRWIKWYQLERLSRTLFGIRIRPENRPRSRFWNWTSKTFSQYYGPFLNSDHLVPLWCAPGNLANHREKTKARAKIFPSPALLVFRALKKFFLDIFAIHLSSGHEKRCQICVRLFSLFRGSIYQQWTCCNLGPILLF